MKSATSKYPLVKTQPLATFRYKGNHSKPVRRAVWLTKIERNVLTGFEVRAGNEICDLKNAVIKSYSRDDIKDLARHSINSALDVVG